VMFQGSKVIEIDISNLGLSGGNLGYQLTSLTSLKNFDIRSNNLGNQIPYDLPPNLETKFCWMWDVSFNSLTDNLPQRLCSMSSVMDMYLQNNQFTGTIDVLADLPLKNMNVANNKFTGWVPSQLKTLICSPAPPPPPGRRQPNGNKSPSSGNSNDGGKKSRISGAAVVGIVVSILVVGAIIAFFLLK
ncbi:STRUBBELIG-receptor family 7-like protein isoform X2, partial [Tanacetum coccineum]